MTLDIIQWEILEDGTISLKTPGISGENHVSADELLDSLAENIGGDVRIEKLKPGYVPKMAHGHGHHVHH